MSRRFVNRLVNGKKTSSLTNHGRRGNPEAPYMFDLEAICEYVRKHSTVAKNGECMIWNGSYSKGGMGNPQITVRDDDTACSVLVTRQIRRALYSAKVGRDIINEKIRMKRPTCGFMDCVNPDHVSFECTPCQPPRKNPLFHGAGGNPNKPVKWW